MSRTESQQMTCISRRVDCLEKIVKIIAEKHGHDPDIKKAFEELETWTDEEEEIIHAYDEWIVEESNRVDKTE